MGDPFIDAWVGKDAAAAAGTEASIGLTKRIPSGYIKLGSRFHPREYTYQRTVYVAEIDMAHTPVTVKQYAAFLSSGAVRERRYWTDAGWAWVGGEGDGWGRENRWVPDNWGTQRQRLNHPVVGVTWHEAVAYCAWVSDNKSQTVRLPTEEEWEHAARGEDRRPYPWGDEFDASLTNTLESDLHATVPAASLPGDASPFGVLDMAGNVQEWTASVYQPLPDEVYPVNDLRVARGGSYNDTAYGARASYRRAYPCGYFFPFLGFRLVVGHL